MSDEYATKYIVSHGSCFIRSHGICQCLHVGYHFWQGNAAHEMSMEQRFTVANMALEAGAKCGLFEADEKTAEYYGMPLEDIDWVCVDDEAKYEKVLSFDGYRLERWKTK